MDVWVTQLRKGLLEFCVLTVLAKGESYGYEIVQRLKAFEQLDVRECTVYPILRRLRRDGYLTVRTGPSEGGPSRRYFSLTVSGTQRLQSMQAHWRSVCESIDDLQSNLEQP